MPVVLLYLVAMATLIAVLDAEPGAVAIAGVAGVKLDAATENIERTAGRPEGRSPTWPALAVLALLGVALVDRSRRATTTRRSGRRPAWGC